MPPLVLNAYAAHYRPLVAESVLQRIEIGQAASGFLKKGQASRIIGRWRRQMQPAPPLKAGTPQQYLAQMGRVGLAVRKQAAAVKEREASP